MDRLTSQITAANLPWEERPLPRRPVGQPTPQARQVSPSPARLHKPGYEAAHSRSASAQYMNAQPTLPDLSQLQQAQIGAPGGLLPPPPIHSVSHSRSSSLDRPVTPNDFHQRSRPTTPSHHSPAQTSTISSSPAPTSSEKLQKKNKHNRDGSRDGRKPAAWILGAEPKPYDVEGLMAGRPMKEIWDDEDGNCEIFLFAPETHRGPSFKVDSHVFASSPYLTKLAFGELYSQRSSTPSIDSRTASLTLSPPSTPPLDPKRSVGAGMSTSSGSSYALSSISLTKPPRTQLYLPMTLSTESGTSTPPNAKHAAHSAADDMQTLVDYRNFFAFLYGSFLVATEKRNSFFTIFMTIAGILRTFEFSNLDGSTYGEFVSDGFDNYVHELRLADVRSSREKTIEGVILGERMKSILLYNEAFTHAVGKHHDLLALKHSKYHTISPVTQNRLARAALDLDKRLESVRLTLTDFDFPFLFSGIMNSKQSEERKEGVKFAAWKDTFMGMRKFTIGWYKNKYGSWPPKASSKKNTLETSGLNRLVLLDLYQDFSSLYDFLVDRTKLTSRTIEGGDADANRESATIRGLRLVLSEFDRSSPPVKPPVPFDLPRLPDLKTTRHNNFGLDPAKDAKALTKKLKDDELNVLLRTTHNPEIRPSPFLDSYLDMERRAAHGSTFHELEALRIGTWIFLYVVLQSLPMLAVDAPSLRHTQGVEYFLCEPPRSGVPWATTATNSSAANRTWFSVAGAAGKVVNLPSDLVEHGVEGIYRRSHCWVVAKKWVENDAVLGRAFHEQQGQHHQVQNQSQQQTHHTHVAQPVPLHPSQLQHGHLRASSADLGVGGQRTSGDGYLRPDSRGERSESPQYLPTQQTQQQHHKRLSSLGSGLEALPLPAGVAPVGAGGGMGGQAVARAPTPSNAPTTFDAILANVETGKKGRKK